MNVAESFPCFTQAPVDQPAETHCKQSETVKSNSWGRGGGEVTHSLPPQYIC